jgi:hypothetical protein
MKKLYFAELFGVVALLGLNSALWHNLGLGLIFLILYFWVVSKPAARWLGRFFTFSPNIPKCLLGAWCAFVLVSVLTGVLVANHYYAARADGRSATWPIGYPRVVQLSHTARWQLQHSGHFFGLLYSHQAGN